MRNLIEKHFDNPAESEVKVIFVSLRGVFNEAISSFADRIRGLLHRRLFAMAGWYSARKDGTKGHVPLIMTFLDFFVSFARFTFDLKLIWKSAIASSLLILLCSLFLCSCARTHAPRRWLSQPRETRTDVYGGWMTVEYATPSGEQAQLAGELIAVGGDSVFVANEQLFAVAQSDIQSARLVAYNANTGVMGGLVALGTMSTISNGFYLIFTAPLWMLGGSVATGKRSHEPILDYPKVKFQRFVPYARYPQGLPAGIDRRKIKMKEQKAVKSSGRR